MDEKQMEQRLSSITTAWTMLRRAHGDSPGSAADATAEQDFRESWRQELLAHAWKAQAAAEKQSGEPFYEVLRFRVEHPDMPAQKAAEVLSARLGRSLNAASFRQLLQRAREQF